METWHSGREVPPSRAAAVGPWYCESCEEALLDFVVFRDPTDWKTWKRWNYCLDCTPLPRAWRCDICGASTGDLRQLMHPRSKRLLGICETCETEDDFCWESVIYEALGVCAVCGQEPRTELIVLMDPRTLHLMSHCFKCATNNKTQVLAKQLRLSIGILFRDAVPDFSKRIAKFLNQKVWVEPGRMEKAFAWAVFSGDDRLLRSCRDEL